MNSDMYEDGKENRWGRNRRGKDRGHIWIGAALLVFGGVLLAREAGVYFPDWLFSWPVILITIGLFTGIRHRFRNPVSFILLIVGGIFLADRVSPDFSLDEYVWPIVLITFGLFFIFRPRSGACRNYNRKELNDSDISSRTEEDTARWEKAMTDRQDVIDVTAIFGGVKKNILTKNLKGGEIVTFMGGAEIDLTKTDFQGKVIIDNFNMFGGTKIIVPPDWDVQSQVVAIFGGVDDKRPPSSNVDAGKILFLDGTCIFGGVEIRSF